MEQNLIWSQFNDSLFRFISGKVATTQDAEDILQNVFIKIHTQLSSVKDEEKIQAWIFKVARNEIVDFYKKREKDIRENPNALLEFSRNTDNSTLDYDENLNQLVSSWLLEMTESLPNHYKEALLYTDFYNHTQKELAEKLGISLSGAKSRVQRGRAKLKDILLECCTIELDKTGNVINYTKNLRDCSCES
ncbi:RNA polymerase sigma-70 factor (ECF subfamily) [Metabacillus crassostreae]|uniref:RNA polymerase sigma factor SigZ n=1 Tax=Metabacillus crassostreae TaxID=929098 RepID=UPI00195CBD25|nr:RNA polymerase sigma factor SigZ [Metabacillus crassostreae]MBM7604300.1 RNA polymerase sigma-70 factor (ECF subfamily) [Metabacillus crassostreae]